MDFSFTKTAILALGLALSSSANATTYYFSETIQRFSITGSFNGTANGDLITGISNISVAVNGISFTGPINDYGYTNSSWSQGDAVVSFDGSANNFRFVAASQAPAPNDTTWGAGSNFFLESGQGGGTLLFYPVIADAPPKHFGSSDLSSWSVTTAVPEPEEWAMMLIGLPLIGWSIRRKSA